MFYGLGLYLLVVVFEDQVFGIGFVVYVLVEVDGVDWFVWYCVIGVGDVGGGDGYV